MAAAAADLQQRSGKHGSGAVADLLQHGGGGGGGGGGIGWRRLLVSSHNVRTVAPCYGELLALLVIPVFAQLQQLVG